MTRLVLLATSHRVAPGLLSWPAWEALHAVDRVLTRDSAHPQAPYVASAGVPVEVLDAATDRELATALLTAARSGSVAFLSSADGDPGLGAALASALAPLVERGEAGGAGEAPEIEVLHGSWDLPGARLLDLVAVMDRLRSPGGCPWDAAQTHESLVPYLLEEAYETVETVETGDLVGLREELGDLLLQVAFHARLGEEHPDSPWSIDDVAGGVVEKLVSRHPHVFAGAQAATAGDVEAAWDRLKAAEKGRTSAVDGVPMAQPALSLASKLMARAQRAGVQVPVAEPELIDREGLDLGELLLAVVALARRRGADPEAELRAAARRYAERIRAAERIPAAERTE